MLHRSTATVEAIDYDKRTVALKEDRGNVVVLKFGPDVKDFKQIKTGDRVTTAGQFWRVDQFFEDCECWRVIDPEFHPNY